MPPIEKAAKVKSYKKTFKDLMHFCKPYRWTIIFVILLGIVSTVIYTFIPIFMKELVSNIKTRSLLIKYSIICLSLLALGIIVDALNGVIFAGVVGKMTYQIRAKSVKKINYLPLNYFDTHKIGDVLSRLTNDADSFQTYMGNMTHLFIGVEGIIGFIIGMFVVEWKLAVIALIGVLISFAALIIIMRKSQKYFTMQQNKLGVLNGFIEENYSNQNIINIFNASNEENQKFDKINLSLKKDVTSANFVSFINIPIMVALKYISMLFLLIVSAIIISKTPGVDQKINFIASLSSILIYLNFLQGQLQQLPQDITSFQQAFASFERLQDFINEKEMIETEPKTILKKTKGNVSFENINFSYKEDVPLIKNFSLDVKSGQKVAIVGKTGAGKTTLVNLLMRFYEIDNGDIKIDGVSIKDISKQNLRDLISMVLQDTWTFDGTIFENIKYNIKNVTINKVKNICKQIGVNHFIETTPHGYNTIVNDKLNISSGEKQLFTIARAMIQNNPIIILDEATSNVDTMTEIKIQNAMDKLSHGRTSFVIAHRLSTIKNADVIVVVNDGQIVEQGNHSSLLKKNGYYAELYNSQFNE